LKPFKLFKLLKLVLIRHGVTIENAANIAQGQTDGTLSEQGIRENETLALQLKDQTFSCIYTSPLGRALYTAKAIHQYHPDIPLIREDRLMERHLGILQERPYPVPYAEADVYEGMETATSMAARLNEFLQEIKQKHKTETVVVVSHGYLIKVLLSILHGWPVEEFYKVKLMGNSAYSTVELA
jgi:broad specificity phosphatase PhoE